MRMVKLIRIFLALAAVSVASATLFAAEETVASGVSAQIWIDTESCATASATIALGRISDVVKVAYSARANQEVLGLRQ